MKNDHFLQNDNVQMQSSMDLYDSQSLAHLPPKILTCLQEGLLQQATELATEIVRCPLALNRWLPNLEHIFEQPKHMELLIELLWRNKEVALNDMFIVGHFMRFCGKTEAYGRIGPEFRSWIASESTPDFRFSENGHLRYFRELTEEQRKDFVTAKYRRWRDFARYRRWRDFRSEEFFRAVDQFSVFADVTPLISEFLFQNRADKSVPFSHWFRDLRSAELLKHILADVTTIGPLNGRSEAPKFNTSHYPRLSDIGSVVDVEHAKSLFGQLDVSKGQLLCTIHDAHVVLAKKCAALCMRDYYILGVHPGQNRIHLGAHAHVSGFHAVKVLRDKKILLMLPDARRPVRQTSEIKIMGIPIAVADGAPTIAFESGCATGWYTMVRAGDRFVPVYEPGPQREINESFEKYKDRWWAFYAAHVEQIFTGDARNITLWHFWPKLFNDAALALSGFQVSPVD